MLHLLETSMQCQPGKKGGQEKQIMLRNKKGSLKCRQYVEDSHYSLHL